MPMRILIADDEPAARFGMTKALAQPQYEVREAADGRAALAVIREWLPDLVFLDLKMPGLDGLGVLRELSDSRLSGDIVVVSANDMVQSAIECMKLGAADYISKPFEVEQLRAWARRTLRRLELERRVQDLECRLEDKATFGALVGASRPMRDLYFQIGRIAPANVDVLIRGETGTGKELVAKEIHRLSGRPGPFVAVNTAAIAESLAESELFGHVKGAFTGADSTRQGFFEQAHGGTLFLDEIGDMPLPAQAKILRALQERRVQPVGSSTGIAVDVRVVAATHQDLEEAIAQGHFRRDLVYRINGFELHVPPLRNRNEDIILLANHFLRRLDNPARASFTLSTAATDRLLNHNWPGNIRELEHALATAAALSTRGEIEAADLRLNVGEKQQAPTPFADLMGLPLMEAKAKLVEDFERVRIVAALDRSPGNLSAAARELGIHRQSLQQKLTQLGIRRGQ